MLPFGPHRSLDSCLPWLASVVAAPRLLKGICRAATRSVRHQEPWGRRGAFQAHLRGNVGPRLDLFKRRCHGGHRDRHHTR